MRSLRLAAVVLALAMIAAACSDDEGDDSNDTSSDDEVTTTTRASSTTTDLPPLTTPTTSPSVNDDEILIIETTTTTTTTLPTEAINVSAPPVPSDLACRAGTGGNELVIEFDALPDPSEISKVRTYLQIDGEPIITNGEFTVGQLDTTRSGGSRWAAPVRNVPANTTVRLYATSFNQLGQESGWYSVAGIYTAPGAPCGTPLPAPTCTAGCDENETSTEDASAGSEEESEGTGN